MNIQIFNFNQAQVRIQFHNGEPLFCLTDVAEILEIKNAKATRFNLKEAGVHKMYVSHESGKKLATFINEPNLYRVIFRSNKPEAVKFQDWIFEEVIPQIRKTGAYIQPSKPTSTDRIGLRQAVSALVSKKHLGYDEAYTLIHHRFNVEHIDQLNHEQIGQAVEYIHRMILNGEVLDKEQQATSIPYDTKALHDLIANVALALRDYANTLNLFQRSPFADERVCQFQLDNLNKYYQGLIDLATKLKLKTQSGQALFEKNCINFYGGSSVFWA